MKKYAYRKRAEVNEYKVGDLVMLSTMDLKYQMVGRRTEKLTKRFVGSYRIRKIVSLNTVELELSSIVKIYLVVNVSRTISDSAVNLFYCTRYLSFPYILHLFRILFTSYSSFFSITTGAGCFFLCPSTYPTYFCWEGRENLENAREVIEEYEKEY